jgi:CheY-like chemotaxis protein
MIGGDMAHVLLIEDSPAQRELFAEFLREDGHVVRTAGEGKEGLALLAEAQPDILVTDILMPGMDGIEALQQALEQHEGLPVVLHTAYPQYENRLPKGTVAAVVVKSCDPAPLKAKLREIVARIDQLGVRAASAGTPPGHEKA